MRLTRHTDTALRCLMMLAIEPDAPLTTPVIARRMRLSEDNLFKVVGDLASLGYVKTTRGRTGGVRLAKAPAAIRIGKVIRDTEESFALVECFDEERNECPIAPACALSRTLDRALKAFLSVLDDVTLADLVVQPRRLERLLAH